MDNQIRDIISNYEPKPYHKRRHSSVLIPLVDVNGEDHVLYEIRSQTVSQPGDTAFPGGHVENGETYEEASIRETMEELGISREQIEVYGEIDYIIHDRADIRCFVGRLHDISIDKLDFSDEVAEVFTVPLSYLINNPPTYYDLVFDSRRDQSFPFERIQNGRNYNFRQQTSKVPFYDLPNHHTLWGFTANMTHRFTQILMKYSNFKK